MTLIVTFGAFLAPTLLLAHALGRACSLPAPRHPALDEIELGAPGDHNRPAPPRPVRALPMDGFVWV
jgi:hypothetical protein